MYRRLALEERMYLALSQNYTFTFALTARLHGRVSSDDLRVALAAAKRRHPLLNVRVNHTHWISPSFVSDRRAELPLRVIDECQDDTWVGVVAHELSQPFNFKRGPFVRCVLMLTPKGAEVSLVFDHLIADGLSAIYLMRDILSVLGNPASPVEVLPLMPPLVDLLLAKTTPPTGGVRRPPTRVVADRMAGRDARPVVLVPWSLSVEETAALTSRSRRERTTVHGAVCAAVARALVAFDPTTTMRRIGSSISLRDGLVRSFGDGLGIYATLVHTAVDGSLDLDFWDVARRFRQDLRRGVSERPLDAGGKGVALLSRLPQALLRWVVSRVMARSHFDDIVVANVGPVPLPQQNDAFWLESLYVVTNPVATNHRFLGVIMLGNRLHFMLALRDRDQASQLQDGLLEQLRGAIGEVVMADDAVST